MLETLNILKDYGWTGLLLALLLVVLYKIIVDFSGLAIEKIKLRMLKKTQERLSTHAFFTSINYMISSEIPSLNFFPDKPVRQILTRDLMYCSLTAMSEVAERMVKQNGSNLNHEEWAFFMRNSLNEMNTLFSNKCLSKGIPEVVYIKYLEWYFQRLNHMRGLVDQISASKLSPTSDSKTSTMLMLFNLLITTMMADCETAMCELNGEITGIPYSGGTIEPLDDH